MVPAGRHQHCLLTGARREDLGCVGRRARRVRPHLRAAVAQLGHPRRPQHRPDSRHGAPAAHPARLAPHGGKCLERSRFAGHAPNSVPRAFSILRRRRQAQLPALPALGRRVSGRALQHCLLRPAHAHAGPGSRAGPRRVHLDRRRHPPLPQPPGPGPRAAHPRPAPAAAAAPEPGRDGYLQLPVRRFPAGKLRPLARH